MLLALTTAANLAAGLIRAKLTAVWLGPSGLGLLSQSQNMALLLGSLGSLGVGVALLGAISRARAQGDGATLGAWVDAATLVTLAAVGGCLVVGVGAGRWLAPALFGGEPENWLALVVGLLGGGLLAMGPIYSSLLYGLDELRAFVAASIAGTLTGVVILALLILGFGLEGALIHVATGPLFMLLFLAAAAHRQLPRSILPLCRWPLRLERAHLRELLAYATYTVATTAAYYGSQLIGRGIVLHRLGLEINGVLQAAVALGSYARQLLSGGIAADIFPAAARAEPGELPALYRHSQRFFLALGLPLAAFVALFGPEIVSLLYSGAFVAAAPLLPVYLCAEIVRLLAFVAIMIMLARRAFVAAAIPLIAGELAFLGALIVGVERGPLAYALAWASGGALALVLAWVSLHVALRLSIRARDVLLGLVLPALLAAGLHVLPQALWLRALVVAAVAAVGWRIGLRPNERQAVLRKTTSFLRRPAG